MTKKAIKLNMIWMMVSLIAFMSCELDNYDMPNAALFGSIVDAETGELLEQDIINGTQIEYIELGFDDRFLRKWSYYLRYCEAAFAMRNISVVQALYTRPNNLSLT